MLRYCTFSCTSATCDGTNATLPFLSSTSTTTSCYATVRSLAGLHICDATNASLPLLFFLHFHTYVMLRYCTFSCTSTHRSCYATYVFLHCTHIICCYFREVLLHFRTNLILRLRPLVCGWMSGLCPDRRIDAFLFNVHCQAQGNSTSCEQQHVQQQGSFTYMCFFLVLCTSLYNSMWNRMPAYP